LTQFAIDHLQLAVAPEDQLSIRRGSESGRRADAPGHAALVEMEISRLHTAPGH